MSAGASGPCATICYWDPFFFILRKLTNVILEGAPVPCLFLMVVVFLGFPSLTLVMVVEVTL